MHRAILVLSLLHTSTLSGDHIDCKLLMIVLEDWLAVGVSSWVYMVHKFPRSPFHHHIENAAFSHLAWMLEALFLTALPSPSSLTTCVGQFELRLSRRQAPSS